MDLIVHTLFNCLAVLDSVSKGLSSYGKLFFCFNGAMSFIIWVIFELKSYNNSCAESDG